jgi:RHS repeat-associated protein
MSTATQLSENSRQGFDGIKAALCLGSMEAKSNTASGMPLRLWRGGIGSRSSGKERDAETGLNFFGARYMSAAQGRFMIPDVSGEDRAPLDPQSWNMYSYVRNRPTRFVDIGGKWATDIHVSLTQYALSGYVSAKELQILVNQQYDMDKHHNSLQEQFKHAMSNGGANQSSAEAKTLMNGFLSTELGLAARGGLNSDGLVHLGNAIHTHQDTTSKVHMTKSGNPLPWNGVMHGGFSHWGGENDPSDDWAGIGQAIRKTMRDFMDANPEAAAKKGLTEKTFEQQSEERILKYVDHYYLGFGNLGYEAARACALHGGAACVN